MTDPIAVAILIGGFLLLLALRVPIALAMVVASIATALRMGISIAVVGEQMVEGLNSFTLLAIPLFILAGDIMVAGGMARRLIDVAALLVGGLRGGLALLNVAAGTLFGFLTGSPAAGTSAIGSALVPEMKKRGFAGNYSVAVTVSGSLQTLLLPPSHNLVVYASAAGGVSVGVLFTAGIVPGLVLGLALAATVYLSATRHDHPTEERVPRGGVATRLRDGFLALLTPVIILGGILSGLFDATEAGAITCVYAALVTFLVYREIPVSRTMSILRSSGATISSILFIIAAASAFGHLMSQLRVPEALAAGLLGISDNPVVVLLLMNLLLLVLGLVMDMAPLILIMTPVLLPIATDIGMDPVHFGIMLILNLGIGLLTPPVASVLYTGTAVGKISVEEAARGMLPFYVVLVAVLLLITFVPALSMGLPRWLGA